LPVLAKLISTGKIHHGQAGPLRQQPRTECEQERRPALGGPSNTSIREGGTSGMIGNQRFACATRRCSDSRHACSAAAHRATVACYSWPARSRCTTCSASSSSAFCFAITIGGVPERGQTHDGV
jgi:hypothetical protein